MTINPFDQEENLKVLFDLNPKYQSSKRHAFEKFSKQYTLNQNIFMSFKESYLKVINFITKNTVLATILMLLALLGATASAAELILPPTSQLRPSTILRNTFGKKVEISKPTIESVLTENPVSQNTPQNSNEPYLKMESIKFFDSLTYMQFKAYSTDYLKFKELEKEYSDKNSDRSNDIYGIFIDTKNFNVGKDGYKIKFYNGDDKTILDSEYEVSQDTYGTYFPIMEINEHLMRTTIGNKDNVCAVLMQNNTILEKTKSCLPLPKKTRQSNLFSPTDLDKAISCPESINIDKSESVLSCKINLSSQKAFVDPLFYNKILYGNDNFLTPSRGFSLTVFQNSEIGGRPTHFQTSIVDECSVNLSQNEIKCVLDKKAIEKIRSVYGPTFKTKIITLGLGILNYEIGDQTGTNNIISIANPLKVEKITTETSKPTNEPYLKLTSIKHIDDQKSLDDPSHSYHIEFESKNFETDCYRQDDSPCTKGSNGYSINVYDGNAKNILKPQLEIDNKGYNMIDIPKSQIPSFTQICAIVVKDKKEIIENTKSCLPLPENRPSTLLQLSDVSKAISCPESVNISLKQVSELVCDFNLPEGKTTTDPLYFSGVSFEVEKGIYLTQRNGAQDTKVLIPASGQSLMPCKIVDKRLKCTIDPNKLQFDTAQASTNLFLGMNYFRSWDTVSFSKIGPENGIKPIITDLPPTVSHGFVFELTPNQPIPNITLNNANNRYEGNIGTVTIKTDSVCGWYDSVLLTGKIKNNVWYPTEISTTGTSGFKYATTELGKTMIFTNFEGKTDLRPCIKFGKTNDLKLVLNANTEVKPTQIDLVTNIIPFGRAKKFNNGACCDLSLERLQMSSVTQMKTIQDGIYTKLNAFLPQKTDTNNTITIGDDILVRVDGFRDFETNGGISDQQCDLYFYNGWDRTKIIVKYQGNIKDGSCEIRFKFDNIDSSLKGKETTLFVMSRGYFKMLEVHAGKYTIK